MSQEAVVTLVRLVAGPGPEEEWQQRAPGEYPARCRFCGDAVLVTIRENDGRVRVGLGHAEPLCADFAQVYENAVD